PVGMNFLVVAYGYSAGDVLADSTLPIENVDAKINSTALAYVRVMDFFGRSGKVSLLLPCAWGKASADIDGQFMSIGRSGLSDPRMKFSLNLFGAPALKLPDFPKYRQKTILGVSLQITAPLGQYDPNLLINLGTNRWSFKPELGISRDLGKWTLEFYGSAAFFTANREYLRTSTLKQNSIYAAQGHVAYTFRRGLWASFDAIYYFGGRTTVDGVKRNDLMSNWRYGFTFSMPLAKQHSLKILASSGLVTRVGSDFSSIGIAYQYVWGGSP
ncbi:MAG: transporter, partial [Blastocatellia bacterium]|nr:transporter [Blastocatellia bacterium]